MVIDLVAKRTVSVRSINHDYMLILREGVRAIRQLAEGKSFENDNALLRYVAQILPSVFSRGTKFERC